MKKIVVLTGSGISAESGIKTFRDSGGLWEDHDVMEVASINGWLKNPEKIIHFYNQRRSQLKTVKPNAAHIALANLEKKFDVTIITQNVDDLHERAGSSDILHLHGELLKVRSSQNPDLIYEWKKDLKIGDVCGENSQLRPHIVWFGEIVTELNNAIEITKQADILIIIGTSMLVYPAAQLINYTKPNIPIFFVDPNPNIPRGRHSKLVVIEESATRGVVNLVKQLID